jgi:hypothetical protein
MINTVMKLYRDGSCRTALLRKEQLWLDGREEYVQGGRWSFDKRRNVLTVKERRGSAGRWYHWKAIIDRGSAGFTEGDFGKRRIIIRAMPPPGGWPR